MDLATVIRYAQIVEQAYGVPPSSLDNAAGTALTVAWGSSPAVEYAVITTIYANDLATDIRPERGKQRVSIGMVLQDTASGEAVIAIRGTEGIYEWLQDAAFLYVPCPIRGSAGLTDDGFTAMYKSVTILPDPGSPLLVTALSTLPWRVPVTSVTVCGHSLGGASPRSPPSTSLLSPRSPSRDRSPMPAHAPGMPRLRRPTIGSFPRPAGSSTVSTSCRRLLRHHSTSM